jgi:hypothetical protein
MITLLCVMLLTLAFFTFIGCAENPTEPIPEAPPVIEDDPSENLHDNKPRKSMPEPGEIIAIAARDTTMPWGEIKKRHINNPNPKPR